MNIEKALRNYIEGKGNKIKYEEFINLVKSNGNNAANVLFKLVNEQLDTMSDTKCLDRTIEVLKYLGVILANCQNVNRKLISRKLFKLEFKLETIESEGKNKFNLKHLQSEFEKLKNQIIDLQDMTDNKDTKQYVSQYVGGKVYSEFKTDENGVFITYLKLVAGNYKLIEVTSPKGYVLDTNGLDFTIGEDTHYAYTTYGPFITVYYIS